MRFENPDNSWGDDVNLQGPQGPQGPTGPSQLPYTSWSGSTCSPLGAIRVCTNNGPCPQPGNSFSTSGGPYDDHVYVCLEKYISGSYRHVWWCLD